MPSLSSVAIREEQATERIQKATRGLSVQLGKKIPEFNLSEKRINPVEKQALTLELVAEILESMLFFKTESGKEGKAENSGVPATKKPVATRKKEDVRNASNNTRAGGSGVTQQAKDPFVGSQANGSRRIR